MDLEETALLRLRVEDVLFAHWPVAPEAVAERLPDALEVDTYDGRAWLGLVAFVVADARPRFSPVGRSFAEVNLRTYVESERGGVYFFELDADDRLVVALARRLFHLSYRRADVEVTRDGEIRVESRRVHGGSPVRVDVAYRPSGHPAPAEPGSLLAFLTSRHRFHVTVDGERYYGDVGHDPWDLAAAEVTVRANDLPGANGFDDPAGDPVAHYSPGVEFAGGRLHRA